jgi:hypothetical protein
MINFIEKLTNLMYYVPIASGDQDIRILRYLHTLEKRYFVTVGNSLRVSESLGNPKEFPTVTKYFFSRVQVSNVPPNSKINQNCFLFSLWLDRTHRVAQEKLCFSPPTFKNFFCEKP